MHVELPKPGEVEGTLRGPFCPYARTLSTKVPFRGEANIVDPCYWTPELPFQYEVDLKIHWGDGTSTQETFLWGLRWCVPHRQDVRLNGRRYVVRAVEAGAATPLEAMREHSRSLVVRSPQVTLLEEATRMGVLLLVEADEDDEADVQQLNRYAAVHFVLGTSVGVNRTNLLRVGAEPGLREVDWAEASALTAPVSGPRPTFVSRRSPGTSLAELSAGCDHLQRDLASFGQFAGYIVRPQDET